METLPPFNFEIIEKLVLKFSMKFYLYSKFKISRITRTPKRSKI